MKARFLAVIILLAPIINANSQEYKPLVEHLKRWDVTNATCGYSPCSYYTSNYLANGDTLINDQTYSKIYDKIYGLESYRPTPALIREDIDSMRVYRYDPYDDQEFLLYDFSILPGDTIEIFAFGPGVNLEVDTIEQITINDEIRKKIIFVEDEIYDSYWIEGLGSIHGLFHPEFNKYMVDGANWLNCVHVKDSLVYMNPNVSSCIVSTVSIESMQIEDCKLLYSPLRLVIPESFQTTHIRIFDINGNLMRDIQNINGNEICLEQYINTPGLYIYEIHSDGYRGQGKFIFH